MGTELKNVNLIPNPLWVFAAYEVCRKHLRCAMFRVAECRTRGIVYAVLMAYTILVNEHLIWTEESRKQVFDSKVFSVWESYCKSPLGTDLEKPQVFTVIDAMDWVIVVPVVNIPKGKQFVMVWQWRHGAKELSLEFPGGVMNPNETPEQAAIRELKEETGYNCEKLIKMGDFSPNPAIMSNRVHFFLAENLNDTGRQNLDEDEFVEVALIDTEEVIKSMGRKPYIHALMGTALSLYQQQKNA